MPALSTAALFPGQGSQREGMRQSLARQDLVEQGIEVLGYDPFERLREGTRYAQPALLITAVASWSDAGLEPVALAGHSLGEYGALVAAGSLDYEDALRVVDVRAAAMATAGERTPGTMLALLGGERPDVERLAAQHGVVVANDNAPGQLVLSGDPEALEAVRAEARGIRAKARLLDVTGAFHSPAMEPAADELRTALAEVEVRPPRLPVISNGSVEPFGEDPRPELVANLLRAVRFRECLLAVWGLGARRTVELAPGSVLTGCAKRTLPEARTEALDRSD